LFDDESGKSLEFSAFVDALRAMLLIGGLGDSLALGFNPVEY